MKAFVLARMVGGQPDIDQTETPYHGYVLCDRIGSTGWGAYLFSGTGAQLTVLDALPQVVGIVAVTQNENVRWAELDDQVGGAVRTKLNNWLSNRGQPTIPEGWSNRRIVREVYKRANANFDLNNFDVAE
jgi:hypothetical protein